MALPWRTFGSDETNKNKTPIDLMRNVFLLITCTAALLTACSEGNESEIGTAPSRAITPESIAKPNPSAINPATAGGPRLNPPHGEPGHICEVAVGAPLDGSTTNAGTSIQMNTSPTATPGSPVQIGAPTSAPGSGRINPPHGEPGHDCAVPVGEPLP